MHLRAHLATTSTAEPHDHGPRGSGRFVGGGNRRRQPPDVLGGQLDVDLLPGVERCVRPTFAWTRRPPQSTITRTWSPA